METNNIVTKKVEAEAKALCSKEHDDLLVQPLAQISSSCSPEEIDNDGDGFLPLVGRHLNESPSGKLRTNMNEFLPSFIQKRKQNTICVLFVMAILVLACATGHLGAFEYRSSNRPTYSYRGADRPEIDAEDDEAASFLSMYGDHQVQPSLAKLPKWFNEYFEWHRNETKHANEGTKYLVMHCPLFRKHCAGLSDRLLGLTSKLFIASKVKRVLCIHWEKPYSLDTFLQPPLTGMDWRCPDKIKTLKYIEPSFYLPDRSKKNYEDALQIVLDDIQKNQETFTSISTSFDMLDGELLALAKSLSEEDFINGMKENEMQTDNNTALAINYEISFTRFGKSFYSKAKAVDQYAHGNTNKANLLDDFHESWLYHSPKLQHIFRVMFQPVQPIARNINLSMTKLGLFDKQYTSVHTRIRHPRPNMTEALGITEEEIVANDLGTKRIPFDGKYKEYALSIAQSGLDCGKSLTSENLILFFSDETELIKDLVSDSPGLSSEKYSKIKGIVDSRGPIAHLDSPDVQPYEQYFPAFEDILLMGGSQCVCYDRFSRFGALGATLAGSCHRGF